MTKKYQFQNATKLLKLAFELDYFLPDENDGITPIPYYWEPGKGNFVVVVGQNASGKSFFRRVLTSVARRTAVEGIHISMEGRHNGGVMSAFVYGDEGHDATGRNSAGTVLAGIRTCKGREKSHIIVWDEPDFGLSDSWARSMGITLRAFGEELPKHTLAAVVITHNKGLLRELLPLDPQFVCFGEEPQKTLSEWLSFEPEIQPLEKLSEESRKRYRLIRRILKD